MKIRSKLIFISFGTAVLVGGVGATGMNALIQQREYLKLGPPTPALFEINRTIDLLSYLVPMAIAVVAGVQFSLAMAIGSRLAQVKKSVTTGEFHERHDELDDVFVSIQSLQPQKPVKITPEAEIVAARRYADNIIDSMYDILIVTDIDLNITSINQAARDLLEYNEIELHGKPIEQLFRSESVLQGPPIRQQLLNSSTRDIEMTYKTRSGRLVYALVSASTMRDEAGQPLAIITVGKDITSRKQIEHDLYEAKVAAEAASRAKSAFVANMSHEIRTPMTAILGYADLLSQSVQSPQQRDQCVQTIRRNGQHLLNIINDILDVSKIEAGRMTVETIPCSPVQLVADVAALMKIRSADKQLQFDVRYQTAVPETIKSDPTRLRQILTNLIGNAIKFTASGSVKVLVSLPENERGKIRFDVIDTGVGLTPKQIESLFRPFVQADESTTRKFGGTGLGLTISKKLAEMLGGDITIYSQPGHGSTFTLLIDTGDLTGVLMIEPQATSAATSETPQFWSGRSRLGGRVLLAEDGPDNRVLISFYLEHAGLDVTIAENGKLACDAALSAAADGKPFDLILMDMQMPEMDGYAATTLLRELKYAGPIVALTAHALGGDREKCIACGCNDFAVKPIDPDRLLATISQYVKTEATMADVAGQAIAAAKTRVLPEPAAIVSLKSTDPAAVPPDTMAALMSNPRMAKLVEKFVTGLDSRVAAIQQAAEAEDRKLLRTLAHQLKGAAGGFGFPAISHAASHVEGDAEAALAQVAVAIGELADSCHAARDQTGTATLAEAAKTA